MRLYLDTNILVFLLDEKKSLEIYRYNRIRMLKKSVLLLKDLFFPREIFIFALKWNCYEQI